MGNDDQANRLDIGHDHAIVIISYNGDPCAGINVYHKKPDGSECVGFVSIRGGTWSKQFESSHSHQAWDLVSREPLTLSPSILCRTCGDHGFVENGRWRKV